jgi:lipopolysaccharide biosynthesis glycosyltransferase
MKAAVVVVADENYLPNACCTLLSAARAGRVDSNLFLLAESAPPEAVESARAFLRVRRVPAIVIDCRTVQGGRQSRWITEAAYTRLHLDEHFHGGWDRILYLDADIRVLAPLRPLLETDLRGRAAGAVLQEKGSTEEVPYFNSGVLLFDWTATVSSGLLAATRAEIRRNPSPDWLDQDVLNQVFAGAWMQLDQRWNFLNRLAKTAVRCRPYIRHLNSSVKPWHADRKPHMVPDGLWYWWTLRNSPWPEFAAPITVVDVLAWARWAQAVHLRGRNRPRLSKDGLRIEHPTNG